MLRQLIPELAASLAHRLLAEALGPLQHLGLSAWHSSLNSHTGCTRLSFPQARHHQHAQPTSPQPWHTASSSGCRGQHRCYATAQPRRAKRVREIKALLSQTREGPEASGPKVTTTAPWPWIDTSRPYILPQLVGIGKPPPVSLQQAIQQVKANVQQAVQGTPESKLSGRPRAPARPDESVQLTVHFLTDPRNSDQIVRGVVLLPHGTGKTVRIAVFARGAEAEKAKQLGVEVIGDEALIQSIIASDGEDLNFDRLVATPEFAKPLARAGKVLGPKGLMPNPKLGTLTEDIEGAVKALRAGQVEFRVGRHRQLQLVIGKANFDDTKLFENVTALLGSFLQLRPKSLQGSGLQGYISGMELKSTHTGTVRIDPAACEALAAEVAVQAQAAEDARAAEAEVEEASTAKPGKQKQQSADKQQQKQQQQPADKGKAGKATASQDAAS